MLELGHILAALKQPSWPGRRHAGAQLITPIALITTLAADTPGSGLYFNLGTTIAFAEHQDAYSHFQVAGGQDMNEAMSKAAAAAGYDSVQFLAHVDHVNYQCDTKNTGRVGFDYMGLEVVAVKLTGTYPCGTANGAPPTIRRGWGGSSACKCDPKKQFLNCEGVPPPPAEWNDPFGDETMRKGQHTTRHTDTNEVWELAMQYSFGKHNLVVDPRKQNGAVNWSPGHIPDINALNKGPGGFHIVADTKVANFLASTYEGDVGTLAVIVERAASIPFAASGEYYQSLVHGRDKIENPPGTTQRLNRRNFTGTKVAKRGDYGPAKLLGHHAVMLLQEVSGALHPESHGFLRSLAELHDNKLPYDLVGQSWTVPNFETYFLQRLSSAVNMAAAHEIRNQVSTGVRLPSAVPKGGRRYRSVLRAGL